jgi:hypothetical protein
MRGLTSRSLVRASRYRSGRHRLRRAGLWGLPFQRRQQWLRPKRIHSVFEPWRNQKQSCRVHGQDCHHQRAHQHYGRETGRRNLGVAPETGIQQRRKLSFSTVATALTNDLGEYRAYWVTAGRYYVSAKPTRESNLTIDGFDWAVCDHEPGRSFQYP